MPGRPSRRDDETQQDARRASGVIPAGALAMLVAISGVFAYGIYLKAAGPSESALDAPARPAVKPPAPSPSPSRPAGAPTPASPAPEAGRPTQIAEEPSGDSLGAAPQAPAELPPVIPEATTASTIGTPLAGGGNSISPGPPSAPVPARPAPVSGSATSSSPAASASTNTAAPTRPTTRTGTNSPPPPSASTTPRTANTPAPRPVTSSPRTGVPGVIARHGEPPDAAAPPTAPPVAPTDTAGGAAAEETASRVSAAPRGTAPAVALRQARDQFGAKRYKEAARSWNDWAVRAPAGSWTVQIAAIRLDNSASTAKLGGIAGRDGAFVLPAGSLPSGLSPVCVGVYPSEEAARRAAATMAPFPGSSSKPIPKPLSSLSH